MRKVKKFTQETCRNIKEAAKEALQEALKPFGVVVNWHGGRFSDSYFNAKLEFNLETPDGEEVTTKESEWYKCRCVRYDMKPEWLFMPFSMGSETYKIIGLAPKAKKYPIIIKKMSDGKGYKASPYSIIPHLKIAEEKRSIPLFNME